MLEMKRKESEKKELHVSADFCGPPDFMKVKKNCTIKSTGPIPWYIPLC
jgi:hypothetical protein